ncbi:MAG: flagellar biosynthesis protein FlhB [Defluviitaleaceae bacterium]|nr:flagellar biosynthesis protein FlhB [Defluviitaleaceae bacterium]
MTLLDERELRVAFSRGDGCRLRLNLAFFADQGEKTEEATHKRKTDARRKGQVANSQEISTAFMLLGAFFSLGLFASWIIGNITTVFHIAYSNLAMANYVYTNEFMVGYLTFMFSRVILTAAPLLAVALMLGLIANLVQVGWHPTFEPLRPKLSKLNPINNFKNKWFSLQVLVNLFKSLFKFAIIIAILVNLMSNEIGMLLMIPTMSFEDSLLYFGGMIVTLGLQVGALFIFIAMADFAYTRFKHKKDLRMSKFEVKQEHKQQEGDPLIKGRIRQKMREASMRRMMKDLPTADVIITNPTHYAVAIKYDKEKYGDAPVVVAKGVDFLAKRIKDIGKENGVQIVENVQLARALYQQVEVGKAIPPELYQAVAEILAFVYRIRNNRRYFSNDGTVLANT